MALILTADGGFVSEATVISNPISDEIKQDQPVPLSPQPSADISTVNQPEPTSSVPIHRISQQGESSSNVQSEGPRLLIPKIRSEVNESMEKAADTLDHANRHQMTAAYHLQNSNLHPMAQSPPNIALPPTNPPPNMAHHYPHYFPFMFPNPNLHSYPGFPPGHMPNMSSSIDPQLLPKGPVRFEVPSHLYPSGLAPYMPFPPIVTPPNPNKSETPMSSHEIPNVEIVPPKTTPLKRKRRNDSGSPTPSRSVRRGTRTRTPKKLADETFVSRPKGI